MQNTPAVSLPDDFEDASATAKGWCSGVKVKDGSATYSVTFYDPVRLAQDVEADLGEGIFFSERNLIVIARLDRRSIVETIEEMYRDGLSKYLLADQ